VWSAAQAALAIQRGRWRRFTDQRGIAKRKDAGFSHQYPGSSREAADSSDDACELLTMELAYILNKISTIYQ
jgi:hypothetical protein